MRKFDWRTMVVVVGLVPTGGLIFAASPRTGQKAPLLSPAAWMNADKDFHPKNLTDRLILVEKWATWCAPCRTSIPHLNQLAREYGPKGLSIVGITDETPNKVRPFLQQNRIDYLIAVGGAKGFVTRGIPHAWLVSPDWNVVWEGHPLRLTGEIIERHLDNVIVAPRLALPAALSTAERHLAAGRYAAGLRVLDKHLSDEGKSAVHDAARKAKTQVLEFGKRQFDRAEQFAKAAEYEAALERMMAIQTAFRGTPLGDRAKETRLGWLNNKTVQAERKAADMLRRVEQLVERRKPQRARMLLERLVKTRSFEGTKARQTAEKLLRAL